MTQTTHLPTCHCDECLYQDKMEALGTAGADGKAVLTACLEDDVTMEDCLTGWFAHRGNETLRRAILQIAIWRFGEPAVVQRVNERMQLHVQH